MIIFHLDLLLCRFGFHRWRDPLWYETGDEVCVRCWKQRQKGHHHA